MRKILILLFVTFLTLGRGVASAATIDFTGVGKNAIVTIGGLYSGTVYAGELNWTWIGAPPSGFGSSLYAYCIDILNDVTDPESVTVRAMSELTPQTSPSTAQDGGERAAWLFDTYAAGIHASGTGNQAAGLQIAIWEALYDATLNLASGNFILAGAVSTPAVGTPQFWANTYLSALMSSGAANGNYSTTTAAWLDAAVPGQDQITAQVPEPAAWLILVAGLFVAAASRRLAF